MAFSSVDTSVILLIAVAVADTSNFPSEFTVMVLYGLCGSASTHACVTAALNLLLLPWWCPGSQLSSFLQSFLSTVTTLASSSCSLGCMCLSRLFSEEGQGGGWGVLLWHRGVFWHMCFISSLKHFVVVVSGLSYDLILFSLSVLGHGRLSSALSSAAVCCSLVCTLPGGDGTRRHGDGTEDQADLLCPLFPRDTCQ